MPKITELYFQNVKGQSGSQPLTGKDIFIGGNGAGKSTRIQVLGGAMLGYVPGHDEKTKQSTFQLATGKHMSMGMRIQDKDDSTLQFEFNRTFTKSDTRNADQKESAKISEAISLQPGQGESNLTQKSNRVEREIGNFPVMLDFKSFLDKTDTQRRDFFYGLSPITTTRWTRERIESYLNDKLLTLGLKANNPDYYFVLMETINEAISKYPVNFSVSAGLQAMIDWVSAQKSFWNTKKNDTKGAVRHISDIKNEQEQTDHNLTLEKQEQADLQNQLVELSGQIAQDKERLRVQRQNSERIAELVILLQNLCLPVKSNVDPRALAQEIKVLETKLIPQIDMKNESDKLTVLEQEARSNYELELAKKTALEQEIIQINAEFEALKKAFETAQGLAGRCVLHKKIKCDRDFSKSQEYVSARKSEIDKFLQEKRNLKTVIEKSVEEKRRALDQIKIDQQALLEKAGKIVTENSIINKQISVLQQTISNAESAVTTRNEQKRLYGEEKERLEKLPQVIIGDVPMMEKQVEGIKIRLRELETSINAKEKVRNDLLLLSQSTIDNQKAIFKADAFTEINKLIGSNGIKGEIVKETLGPIQDDIAANLTLMGFNYTPYFQMESDTGKEVFEFGWVNQKGHSVNFNVMSAGEQIIFLAAIMVTIVDRAKPKLRMLVLDNLTDLIQRNFQRLLNGLNGVAHKLDNIILAGAVEYSFEADGWKVWDLGPGQNVDGDINSQKELVLGQEVGKKGVA
jgi:exonuclease SbcC